MDVGAVEAPRFRGANHADDNDNRFRHRQVSFPGSRRRRWRPSGHSPPVEAPLRLGVLPETVALSGRYRSLRLGAPLVARAPGTGSHRAVDPTGVWLWDEYAGRWGPDCGIDLVFESKIGKTWAVQAKCYSSDYDISKNDVDTFLSESNRKQIDHRLLITTTDRIGANARQVLDAQEKPVVRYLLAHFEDAAVEFPASVETLSLGKRKPPPEPDRPHQIEAVDALIAGFPTHSRGQLIFACRHGKTF